MLAADRIICTDEKVDQSVDQSLITLPNSVKNPKTQFKGYNVWVPVPKSKETAKDDYPYMHLQQPYGVQAPRLLNVRKGATSNNGELAVSAKGGEAYHQDETSVWKIYKAMWRWRS